jgi:hypothetical protein
MYLVFNRLCLAFVATALAVSSVGCGGASTREIETPAGVDPDAGLTNPDQDPTMRQAEESLATPGGDPSAGPPT